MLEGDRNVLMLNFKLDPLRISFYKISRLQEDTERIWQNILRIELRRKSFCKKNIDFSLLKTLHRVPRSFCFHGDALNAAKWLCPDADFAQTLSGKSIFNPFLLSVRSCFASTMNNRTHRVTLWQILIRIVQCFEGFWSFPEASVISLCCFWRIENCKVVDKVNPSNSDWIMFSEVWA